LASLVCEPASSEPVGILVLLLMVVFFEGAAAECNPLLLSTIFRTGLKLFLNL
jgi:hypothetical protein